MTNREMAKAIRAKITGVDTVGVNKDGDVVARRGFFYRHGQTAEKFALNLQDQLIALGFVVRVVDSGEVWKPFRGGAKTAQQSHFYAVLSCEAEI